MKQTGKKEWPFCELVFAVNDKYGEYKLTWASTATEERGHGVISPAWRPSGIRKSDV